MMTVPSLPLIELINETRVLFHRLKTAGDELHKAAGINSSQRGVMETLYLQGPCSVPKIARDKSVSRQHIQLLMNQLLEKSFVEQTNNPAHKRSTLFTLTAQGRTLFDAIRNREINLLKSADHQVNDATLTQAIATLRKLNAYFESEGWESLLTERGNTL